MFLASHCLLHVRSLLDVPLSEELKGTLRQMKVGRGLVMQAIHGIGVVALATSCNRQRRTCVCLIEKVTSSAFKDRFDNIVMRKMATPVLHGERYAHCLLSLTRISCSPASYAHSSPLLSFSHNETLQKEETYAHLAGQVSPASGKDILPTCTILAIDFNAKERMTSDATSIPNYNSSRVRCKPSPVQRERMQNNVKPPTEKQEAK
jgi:hypothetical protein